jgi:2-oxoglutarate dehydrogenase E1 component
MLSRQVLRRLRAGRWAVQGLRFTPPLHRHLATPAASPSPNDPFANGTNAYYAEEMYRHWRQDPTSVHTSWDVYFSGLDKGLPSPKAFSPPPSLFPAPADGAPALHVGGGAELDDHLKVGLLPFITTGNFFIVKVGPIAC